MKSFSFLLVDRLQTRVRQDDSITLREARAVLNRELSACSIRCGYLALM
jgi:hypothetical protein